MVASIRHPTSTMSSICFLNLSLSGLGALAAGSSGTGFSMTYSFLSCQRTILKLRNQSRKLMPFNFSFSRSDRSEIELFAIIIYNGGNKTHAPHVGNLSNKHHSSRPSPCAATSHAQCLGISKSAKAESTAEPAKAESTAEPTKVLKSRPLGGYASDTEVAKDVIHEQCKAISTRSGKVLKTPIENKQGETTIANSKVAEDTYNLAPADTTTSADEDHNIPAEYEEAEITTAAPQTRQPRKDLPEEPRPPLPFPQRFKKQKQEYQYNKFFDILKQVHINLPLVEALHQMPNYAKFLKTWCQEKQELGNLRLLLPQKHV
ncbi:hypothetical protein V6N12_012830 [Hibiscus sabdariffa]|uniref:Uncharacterized protein n=1 Tax=Hibiscus sabdariffa TaxID=183260 RepID=A0ABR2EHV6_9ROSI